MSCRFFTSCRSERGVLVETALLTPLLIFVIAVFTNLFFMFSNVGQIEESVHEAVKYAAVAAVVEPTLSNQQILDKAKTRIRDFIEEKCLLCKSYTITTAEAPYPAPLSGTEATFKVQVIYETIPWLSHAADIEISLASKGVLRP